MKELLVILRRNLGSPIVISIAVLAFILLILGEVRDAWFVSVVILFNSTIAIIQEVRARNALKKLELMNAPRANRLLGDGSVESVMFDQLLVGDVIKLQLGDEVPADGKITLISGLEIDESILTGESIPVNKVIGAEVLASSVVVAGTAEMLVSAVGVDTKMGKIAATLKQYKPELTPLQKSINSAITVLTYGALVLASLIFTVYYFSGQNAVLIFKTITSAAVTVVPEGLLLGSSLLLAYGSIRLAQAKVLPQKLSAIEAMALLDVLCVDKTGTLTSDKIVFDKLDAFDMDHALLSELTGVLMKETSGGNSTGDAVIKALPVSEKYEIIDILPFSSARKMSGIRIKINKKIHTIFIGAPEFLGILAPLSNEQKQYIELLASEGKRVLMIATFDDNKLPLPEINKGSGEVAGVVILTNELRIGVQETVSYLQRNNVSLRVISGDNPSTVRYIADRAGVNRSDRVITGAELAELSDEEFPLVVRDTTIFARVLPEQKERIISTFKDAGKFTGMVGDGVNDALAIKKSDLGVSMFAGAVATRRVADIILLDNSFNSLPIGMRLGNRIMQAIEMISALFFHKIIYGVVLLLSTLALGLVYPFGPRHITFMNIFLVTMPTIIWTMFPPSPRRHISPKYYWKDTLLAVMPIAMLSGIVVTTAFALLTASHPNNELGVSTTVVLIATFFGAYLVLLVPRMFDVRNTKKAQFTRVLYIVAAMFVVASSFGIGFIREFFDFTMPTWQNAWPILLLIIATAVLQWQIAGSAGQRLRDREKIISNA